MKAVLVSFLIATASLSPLVAPLLAQTAAPAAEPQLSPRAAYADAMQPLDSTRSQVQNWSDAEIAALKVTVGRAAEACEERHADDFDGDALVDLARLCALGQNWLAVVESTSRYIAAKDTPSTPAAPETPKALLAEAYAAQIDANLHLKDEAAAMAGARVMLARVPYSALAAQAIDELLAYTQFAFTTDALALAELRQPLLLANLKAATASTAAGPKSPDAHPPQSVHELYDDGLMLASLEQLAGKAPHAAEAVATLDSALPAKLEPDDAVPVAASRRRYALLGSPVPGLLPTAYLRRGDPLPQIPAANAITALLLFPDWCAQCVRMGRAFPPTVFSVSGHEAYLYGLLAETVPPHKVQDKDGFDPADSSLILDETPTLVIPSSVFDRFAVNGIPFLVIADPRGIIRVAQPIDPTAIQPGSTVDTAIACVGFHWGLPKQPAQKNASRFPLSPGKMQTIPPAAALH